MGIVLSRLSSPPYSISHFHPLTLSQETRTTEELQRGKEKDEEEKENRRSKGIKISSSSSSRACPSQSQFMVSSRAILPFF
jgi:hypothetical protein